MKYDLIFVSIMNRSEAVASSIYIWSFSWIESTTFPFLSCRGIREIWRNRFSFSIAEAGDPGKPFTYQSLNCLWTRLIEDWPLQGYISTLPRCSLEILEMTTGMLCSAPPWKETVMYHVFKTCKFQLLLLFL